MKNVNIFKQLLNEKTTMFEFKEKYNGDIILEQFREKVTMDMFREVNDDVVVMSNFHNYVSQKQKLDEGINRLIFLRNNMKNSEELTEDINNIVDKYN